MKVINAAVLSCLDDMFYRLPFPNQVDLERLIKEAQGEAAMIEFKHEIRAELDTPRALNEFESGWEKYWRETGSQKRGTGAPKRQPTKSCKDRMRSATPPTPGGDGADAAASQSLR